jgi:hypothetical protein
MKKILFFLLLISSLFAIAQNDAKTEVNEFIDQWHLDAANIDRKAYFDKIEKGGVFIGTDATEVWTKQEFYDWAEPHFTGDGEAWSFTATERNVYYGDDAKYVWFDELLSFSGGILRGSGVLVKRGENWKIAHYVLSLPVPNDKFKGVLNAMEE